MLATLTIDAELLQTAIDLDTRNTKDTIVEAALREYIQRRLQLKQAVMIGAEAADRGDVIDGESAIVALREKLNVWRTERMFEKSKVVTINPDPPKSPLKRGTMSRILVPPFQGG